MASGGVCWFYIVSGGFRPSLVLLSTERLNVGLDLMCSFSRKNLLHTSFCTKLQSFLFSTFKYSWRKIVSKDFCTFTGVYIAINMGPCHRSYILIVQKFWTSKMLDKWSPTSKLSNIKLSHYLDGRHIFFTWREPACLPYLLNLFFDIFKSFPLFIMTEFRVLANMSILPI